MRQVIGIPLKVLAAGAMVASLACGGGGGGDGQETAELIGTVSDPVVAGSVHRSSVTVPVNVVAVDEDGNVADSATDVTDQFTLTVPTGHDYVVIVSDDDGIIAAMVYGADDRPDFTVAAGSTTIHLGNLTVDRATRSVRADDAAGELAEPGEPRIDASIDNDGDHIPDGVDNDDDNDGIDDVADVSDGHDRSRDHDNDGLDDSVDTDDDNDGIGDTEDDYPHDVDNDGEDDDRDDDDASDDSSTADGDAVAGAIAFAACAGCHGSDGSGGSAESIRGESAGEIAEALAEGEDGMPAFPDLVDAAADIAAFLSSTSDTTGNGTDTGSGTDAGTDTGNGTGSDATVGATLYAANACPACHGADGADGIIIVDATETQVASALQNGPGSMPTYPDLVGSAADIASFLSQ
ncbi:MAG: cytochrome c [Nitrospirota bacterium]|jgi:mono/diheme cytochrome c family protein